MMWVKLKMKKVWCFYGGERILLKMMSLDVIICFIIRDQYRKMFQSLICRQTGMLLHSDMPLHP